MSAYLPTMWSAMGSDAFNRQIDRIFEEAVHSMSTDVATWAPPCNAWEDGDGFYVQVALPGWDPKDVALEVNNQALAIKGMRTDQSDTTGTYHLREIQQRPFVRLFRLPASVDHEKGSATHKNGLLTITFPKREEAKVRRILIQG